MDNPFKKMFCYTSQLKYVFRLEENMSCVKGQNSLFAPFHMEVQDRGQVRSPALVGYWFYPYNLSLLLDRVDT